MTSNVVGHYDALIHHGNRIEFNDSMGFFQTILLSKNLDRIEKPLVKKGTTYLNYFTSPSLPVEYNEFAVPKRKTNVSTCGYYSGLRCRYSSIPLEQYQQIFKTLKRMKINTDIFVKVLGDKFLKD